MQERQEWVEHKFNLGINIGWSKNVLSRIKDTSIRIEHYVKNLTNEQLSFQENGKWSIKEHIGHLTDVEELWLNRFLQFEKGLPELVAADMSNKKTEKANHNASSIDQLIANFNTQREELILQFQKLSKETQMHQAFHPRLKMMMRPVDLLFFIAEHDSHHLVNIQDISGKLSIKSILQQFIIIEHFDKNKIKELYKRFDEKGRMLPIGVKVH